MLLSRFFVSILIEQRRKQSFPAQGKNRAKKLNWRLQMTESEARLPLENS
jgi:hypothetical protein